MFENLSLPEDFHPIQNFLKSMTFQNLVTAGIIVLITFLILRAINHYFDIKARKDSSEAGSYKSINMLIRYFVITVSAIVLLDTIGLPVTALLASMTALLVGVGLGIQQLFMDISSGIIILFERSLKINDVVELENNLIGKVVKIKLRTSVIKTRDDIYVIVPNSKLVNDRIINWSLNDFKTRFHVEIGVSYNSDVRKVEKILLDCANKMEGIDDSNPPFVFFVDYADSALIFRLYFWSYNTFRVEKLKSQLRFEIFDALKVNGITIPFPQLDVHMMRSDTE